MIYRCSPCKFAFESPCADECPQCKNPANTLETGMAVAFLLNRAEDVQNALERQAEISQKLLLSIELINKLRKLDSEGW